MYKFYVKMDGDTFGPYTAKQIQELQLMDDILVTEESMNEWLPASRFDFNDMAKKELNELLSQRRTQNNDEENVGANNPFIAQYSGSYQKTSSKPRKTGKTILYGFISIIAVAILGGLLYYKQTQNNEAKLEQNKLIAFAKYNHIGDFGEHGASGLALVEMEVDGDDFYGMINGRYEEVVPCIYQEINQFEYGVSVARLNGKYAVINTEGSIKKHLNYTNVLDFSDDGRLYWIGELTPGIYETKFNERLTYTVMAVYESNKAVRIYPVLPDCEDLTRMIGGKLWFNRDDAGNLCLKLDQCKEQKLSAADYLNAAIKWLKKYEMMVCGFTQPLTGCLSQI